MFRTVYPRALVGACLLTAAILRVALAGSPSPGGPTHDLSVLERLPNSVDTVLVIRGGAGQRSSAPGQSLSRMCAESGLFTGTLQRWSALAEHLGWKPGEAFDLLLGRRVIFVLTGLRGDEPIGWALISEVDVPTEARLRDRLSPAPRRLLAGQPVLNIENGRFQCAIRRESGAATVVIAPAESQELLDHLLMSLYGTAASPRLGDTAPFRRARPLMTGDVFTLVRLSGRVAAGLLGAETVRGQGEVFFAVGGDRTADGWRLRSMSTPGLVWPAPSDNPSPWPPAAYGRLVRSALIAEVVRTDAVLGDGDWLWNRVRTLLDIPGEARDLLGPVAAVVVRGDGPHDTDGLSVSVALSIRDVGAVAPIGDRAAATLITALEAAQGTSAGPPPMFDGAVPEAIRTFAVRGGHAAELSPLGIERPVLSWAYISDGGPEGWWILQLARAPGGTLRALAGALESAADGAAPPHRISMGAIRPSGLDRALPRREYAPPDMLRAARYIDAVEWDAWAMDEATVGAAFSVRMIAP